MATIGTIALQKDEIFTTAHVQSMNRANDGYSVITGCDVHQKTVPGMGITIDAGSILYNGGYVAVAGGNVVIDAADSTPRFDVVYLNAAGSGVIAKGTAASILPTGETDSKKMNTPSPLYSIPTGVILARVYVANGTTSIIDALIDDIAMSAAQVPLNVVTARGDLITRNANVPTRLAIGAANTILFTDGVDPSWGLTRTLTVAATASASDTKIPSEQGVRELIDALRVRNYAWNSSFEFFLGTTACLGWTQLSTATIAQDIGVRDGYDGTYALKVTSAGSGKEGVSQTLKDLKASTTYTVRLWMKATAGDTAKAFTTGATSQLSITSTSATGEYVVGMFTTDATPTDVVLKLGSDTSGDIVWFDCLTVTEGAEVPPTYFKSKEWDAPKQIAFGKGDGSAVVGTGAIPGVVIAEDNYQIIGWKGRSNISATVTYDVWRKSGSEPTNTDSLGVTKATFTGVSGSGVPDWSVTEVSKGDQIRVEIEANNNGTEIDFILLIRRR